MGDYIVVLLVVAVIVAYICKKGGIRRTPKNIDLYRYCKDEHSGRYTQEEMRERIFRGYYNKRGK